jgi:anti-anti-sigma regulatory factor
MTTVYHEVLPSSYLLLLLPGPPQDDDTEPALQQGLRSASCSGKAAVWVDCELMSRFSPAAVRTLWEHHCQLQAQGVKLVLVHASEEVKQAMEELGAYPDLCFANDLCDAAWQSGLGLVA